MTFHLYESPKTVFAVHSHYFGTTTPYPKSLRSRSNREINCLVNDLRNNRTLRILPLRDIFNNVVRWNRKTENYVLMFTKSLWVFRVPYMSRNQTKDIMYDKIVTFFTFTVTLQREFKSFIHIQAYILWLIGNKLKVDPTE